MRPMGMLIEGVKKIISIMGVTIQKVKLIHYLATIENESD